MRPARLRLPLVISTSLRAAESASVMRGIDVLVGTGDGDLRGAEIARAAIIESSRLPAASLPHGMFPSAAGEYLERTEPVLDPTVSPE